MESGACAYAKPYTWPIQHLVQPGQDIVPEHALQSIAPVRPATRHLIPNRCFQACCRWMDPMNSGRTHNTIVVDDVALYGPLLAASVEGIGTLSSEPNIESQDDTSSLAGSPRLAGPIEGLRGHSSELNIESQEGNSSLTPSPKLAASVKGLGRLSSALLREF